MSYGKPIGFVAICPNCGVVGALDYERIDRKYAGKILGEWLADGFTVQPRFSMPWRETVHACTCGTCKKPEAEKLQ